MSSWGLVFTEGRQRKEIGQPQSWFAHPPRRGLYPRSRAKTGTRKNTVSQTKVITCPYFISSSQKQCFPGLEKCHILLPFPKATAATFHHCTWVTGSLLREDELWDFTFLFPTPRGYTALAKGKESYAKGPLSLEAAKLFSFPWYLITKNSFDLIPRSKRHQGTYNWMKTLSV